MSCASSSPGPTGDRSATRSWPGTAGCWRLRRALRRSRPGASALTRRVAAEPVLAPLLDDPVTDDPVLAPWLDVTGRVGLALESLRRRGHAVRHRHAPRAPWPRSTTPPAIRRPGARPTSSTPMHAFDLADADLEPPPVPAVAGLRRHRLRALHRVGPRRSPTRATAARWPATSGTSPTATPAAGWCRWAPSPVPADPHHLDQLPLWADGAARADRDRLGPALGADGR